MNEVDRSRIMLNTIIFFADVQSIPQLFETNVDPDSDRDKKLWAVMNYLGGYTLDKYVSRYTLSKLPLKAAISITRQLLSILKAVHTRGVVHRDLKPNNIMIDPETTTLTVIDFGMSFNQACEITDPLDNPDEEGTSIGVELGNRFFRPPQLESHVFSNSPEDLRQKRRNPKVDASMTGALLFWMITGWKPMVSKEKYGATFYRVPDCVALFERSIADAAPSMSDFLLREIENELSHYYLDDSRLQKKLRDRFNRTFEKAFADYDDQWTVDGLGERLAAIEEDLFEEEEHYHQVEKIIPGQVSNGSIPRSPVSRSFNSYHPLSPLAQSFATANRISPAPPAAKPASGRFSNDHSRDHEPRSGSTPSEDEWVTSEPRKSHQRRR